MFLLFILKKNYIFKIEIRTRSKIQNTIIKNQKVSDVSENIHYAQESIIFDTLPILFKMKNIIELLFHPIVLNFNVSVFT